MISKQEFCDEFADLADQAGISETCAIEFTDEVRTSPRSYAAVDPYELHFYFAPETLSLPWEHRRGLIMHEIGHVLCPEGSESDADRAAEEVFGEKIIYDKSWPGKGLQCVRCSSNPSNYKYLPLSAIRRWEPLMRSQGVSEVARSSRGFLSAYKRAKGDPDRLSDAWDKKRAAFIKRHTAQIKQRGEPLWEGGEPTRRHLALIAWAYSPTASKLSNPPNPPYSGYDPRYYQKALPKDPTKVAYDRKRDALNVFLDWNRGIVDDYGGESMRHSPESFEAINHRFDITGKRRVDTIAKAVWWALPSGSPYYLEDIDVELLNRTAPAIYNSRGLRFSIPDYAEERRLIEKEAEYWESRYGDTFPEDDDEVPF